MDGKQWTAVGINGGRAWTNDIQLDGLPVMGGGYNEVSVLPNTEGLSEVKVIANDFSAQYGRGQGIYPDEHQVRHQPVPRRSQLPAPERSPDGQLEGQQGQLVGPAAYWVFRGPRSR